MIYLIFLELLLITILIEGIVIFLIFRSKKYLYYSVLVNLLTNPALNLLLMLGVKRFGESGYEPILIILEIIVIFIEAYVYDYLTDLGLKKSLFLSVCLNALSCLGGIIFSFNFLVY